MTFTGPAVVDGNASKESGVAKRTALPRMGCHQNQTAWVLSFACCLPLLISISNLKLLIFAPPSHWHWWALMSSTAERARTVASQSQQSLHGWDAVLISRAQMHTRPRESLWSRGYPPSSRTWMRRHHYHDWPHLLTFPPPPQRYWRVLLPPTSGEQGEWHRKVDLLAADGMPGDAKSGKILLVDFCLSLLFSMIDISYYFFLHLFSTIGVADIWGESHQPDRVAPRSELWHNNIIN